MKWLHYVRVLTYVAFTASIGLLWFRYDDYAGVRLVREYPSDYLIPMQLGSWRDTWFDGAEGYRKARLGPKEIMDLAERELLTTDWKSFQPESPKIWGVTLRSSEIGLVWGVEWIDANGYRFDITVYDATGEVRHSPTVEETFEKDWTFPTEAAE